MPGFRTALTGLTGQADADGLPRLEVTFQDARHAEWALWQHAPHAEVLAPQWLRTALHDRAAAITARYGGSSPVGDP